MAATINDRDLTLASSGARLLSVDLPSNISLASARRVEITAPSEMFRIETDGTAQPSSIVLTAVLTQLSGEVTWSVVTGTAILTTTGVAANQRLLTAANMTSTFVTIRASLTFNGILHTADFSVAKINNGSSGLRGSVVLVGTGSVWSDAVANSLILSFTGSNLKVVGDRVTINNGSNFASTRYWTGLVWAPLASVIDGNMLVTGSIFANHLTVNSISTTNVQANTATIAVSAYTAASMSIPLTGVHTLQTLPAFTSKGGIVVINFGCVMVPVSGNTVIYSLTRNGTSIFSITVQVANEAVVTFPPITDTPGTGVSVTYAVTADLNNTGSAASAAKNRGLYALEAVR